VVFLTGTDQRQTLEKLAADKKLKVPLVVPKAGKGNRHHTPLVELKVLGRAGNQEVQKWRQEWLR